MDRKLLRQKILINLTTSPVTLFPCLLGLTLGAVLWSFSVKAGMWTVIAITSFLIGAGSCFTRLILGDERLTKKSIEELKQEIEKQKEQELDQLYEQLPLKSRYILQTLREFWSSFHKMDVTIPNFLEISRSVEQLFQGAIFMLKQSLEIQKMLDADHGSNRKSLSARFNQLIQDAQKNTDAIGELLSSMIVLTAANGLGSDNQETLRADLAEKLEIAKRVHDRMSEFNPGLATDLGELKTLQRKTKKREIAND